MSTLVQLHKHLYIHSMSTLFLGRSCGRPVPGEVTARGVLQSRGLPSRHGQHCEQSQRNNFEVVKGMSLSFSLHIVVYTSFLSFFSLFFLAEFVLPLVGLFRLQSDFRIQVPFRKQWKCLLEVFFVWILTFQDSKFNLVPPMYSTVCCLCGMKRGTLVESDFWNLIESFSWMELLT